MIGVILNADDFGMSRIFNDKILDLLESGNISSTTVLVNRVNDAQDAQIGKLATIGRKGSASVGLHTEVDPARPMHMQLEEQYAKFSSIFGFTPSHLDLHVPRKLRESIGKHEAVVEHAIDDFAAEMGIPYRNHGKIRLRAKSTAKPVFFCTGKSFSEIEEYLMHMREGESYELLFHPGEYDPECDSSLNEGRLIDYDNAIKAAKFIRSRAAFKMISYLEL